MNYKRFLESNIGSFVGRSKLVRNIIWKLFIRQQSKIKMAIVPEHILKEYGEKRIKKIMKNHKGEGDFIIGSTRIKIIRPHIN